MGINLDVTRWCRQVPNFGITGWPSRGRCHCTGWSQRGSGVRMGGIDPFDYTPTVTVCLCNKLITGWLECVSVPGLAGPSGMSPAMETESMPTHAESMLSHESDSLAVAGRAPIHG